MCGPLSKIKPRWTSDTKEDLETPLRRANGRPIFRSLTGCPCGRGRDFGVALSCRGAMAPELRLRQRFLPTPRVVTEGRDVRGASGARPAWKRRPKGATEDPWGASLTATCVRPTERRWGSSERDETDPRPRSRLRENSYASGRGRGGEGRRRGRRGRKTRKESNLFVL